MAPAIALARDGFVLGQGDTGVMSLEAAGLARDPAAARIFLPQGASRAAGDRLVQPELAETLMAISRDGPDAMYRGPIGAAIAQASQAGGGVITLDDFALYRVRELSPVGGAGSSAPVR